MKAIRALAVCALVVLAGCSGPLGSLGGGDGGPSPPPGVEGDQVNATVLLDAHVASLDNESFTATFHEGLAGQREERTARVSENGSATVERTESSDDTTNVFVANGATYWPTMSERIWSCG